ncbi:hypothetical protein Acr_14g0003960 [Actinidia rufa]|uniref:Uncharacterized protein n=1 Tax=Actinidia rufa TaxID=165716 RepID=A0A7J0FQ42_9ERIC|nr:hypothetical protein Acr_14g0003960 [Actinidia rufa]
MDKSDGRVESLWDSNGNRYNHGRDQVVKSTEAINGTKESSVATNSVDTGTLEGCSASGSSGCPTNGTRNSQAEESNADDGGQNIDEDAPDVPPGFPPLNAPSVPSNASSTVTDIHQGNGIPSKFPRDAIKNPPSATGARPPDMENQRANNQNSFNRVTAHIVWEGGFQVVPVSKCGNCLFPKQAGGVGITAIIIALEEVVKAAQGCACLCCHGIDGFKVLKLGSSGIFVSCDGFMIEFHVINNVLEEKLQCSLIASLKMP